MFTSSPSATTIRNVIIVLLVLQLPTTTTCTSIVGETITASRQDEPSFSKKPYPSTYTSDFDCRNATKPPVKNYFNIKKYECKSEFFGVAKPLKHGIGYAVVLAFGLTFGLATIGLVYMDQYFFRRTMNSEYFNTAGRSVRTGLTASVIVSQWTWAATLLQSSTVAYKYGVSGPLWYAGGATIQVILFSTIAVLVKLRAPTAHTFLEIVRARWGTFAHIVFLIFAMMTNILVTSMLILGGSDVVNALTGINVDLAGSLIPLGVILYTLAGGLKATFVASYFNTALLLISLVIFMFEVYFWSSELGSASEVYDRLELVSKYQAQDNIDELITGNKEGSYLTMLSRDGFYFGMVNLVVNFGTVFIDQSYWQSAIAATPTASWKGYLLGGLCWFAIPFSLATSLGLAAVALSLPISEDEVNKGLVPPATVSHLMGDSGSVLFLIMLFMAVTSSGASEQIAFSSIISYDIYRTYINPNCSGQRVISLSRATILIFGVLMGFLSIALHAARLDINFLYRATGIFIGPAVVPVAYAIAWGRASGPAAISGALSGIICGITTWLTYGYFHTKPGLLNLKVLKEEEVMLAGNLVSIFSSGIVCTIISLLRPDDCDWSTTRAIPLIEDDPNAHIPFEDEENLERALRRIGTVGIILTLLLVLFWPLFSLPFGVFSKGYFTFWVVLSFIWGLISCIIMIVLPVIESRNNILTVITGGQYAAGVRRGVEDDDEESIDDFEIEER